MHAVGECKPCVSAWPIAGRHVLRDDTGGQSAMTCNQTPVAALHCEINFLRLVEQQRRQFAWREIECWLPALQSHLRRERERIVQQGPVERFQREEVREADGGRRAQTPHYEQRRQHMLQQPLAQRDECSGAIAHASISSR